MFHCDLPEIDQFSSQLSSVGVSAESFYHTFMNKNDEGQIIKIGIWKAERTRGTKSTGIEVYLREEADLDTLGVKVNSKVKGFPDIICLMSTIDKSKLQVFTMNNDLQKLSKIFELA